MAYRFSKGPRGFGDITFEDDADTGIDFEPDIIKLETGGVERVVIKNEGVGIGTNNPQKTLHLIDSGNCHIRVEAQAGYAGINFKGGSSASSWVWQPEDSSAMRFEVGGSDRMAILNDGKVGIGTNSPTEILDVNSGAIRIRSAQTPASATATGTQGQICWDPNYIYVCTGTDQWKRASLSSW